MEAEAEAEAAERASLLAWRRRETAPLTEQLHAHEWRARAEAARTAQAAEQARQASQRVRRQAAEAQEEAARKEHALQEARAAAEAAAAAADAAAELEHRYCCLAPPVTPAGHGRGSDCPGTSHEHHCCC